MKILQVVHNFLPYSYAGTEIYTYNLSKELSKRHKVFVFHRIRDERRKDYELKQYPLNCLEIFSINNTCRSYDNFEDTYNNRRIDERFARVLDSIKPDIVHVQHLLFLSTSLIRLIKQRNIPIVFTLHDYWLLCPQGQFLKDNLTICNASSSSECAKCMISQLSIKKGILSAYYKLRARIPSSALQLLKKTYLNYAQKSFLSEEEAINKIRRRKDFIKQLFEDVNLFVAPSRFLRNKFIEHGMPPDKIIFIRNGIDAGQFKHFERKKSDNIRFGFIGTIHPSKGIHILIEAFNRIKNENAELKIYGELLPYSGFEYYPRLLRKICRNKNTYFMGGFENSRVAEIFSEIDVLVFLSIWQENSPLTVQEAFSTNTPVIGSRIGGVPELIEDKKNGLLVEPGEPDDLYDKIKSIVNNPGLIESLRRGIDLPKSMEENRQEVEGLYKDLLKNKSD